MSSAKQTFKTLDDFQKAISVVDEFAASNNVPDLAFPGKEPHTAEVVALPAAASSLSEIVATEPAPAAKPSATRKPRKQPVAEEEEAPPATRRLTLDLPTDLFDAITKRSQAQGATAKYIVLQALKNDNFTIPAEHMTKDGRRAKKEVRHAA